MNDSSILTICVPTFNRAEHLQASLKSILTQTERNFTLYVLDDASTDSTAEVVSSFNDARIRYVRHEKNRGLYGNMNYALNLPLAKYLAIYHDHDLYCPTIVSKSLTALMKNPCASYVHTGLVTIADDGEVTSQDVRKFAHVTSGPSFMKVIAGSWSSPVMAATVMMRSDIFKHVGGFDDKFGLNCDADLWWELGKYGSVLYLREPLAKIRERTAGMATAKFRWATVEKGTLMREKHVLGSYRNNAFAWLRYIVGREYRLLVFQLRALIKENPAVVSEGWEVILRKGGTTTRVLVGAFQTFSVLRFLLKFVSFAWSQQVVFRRAWRRRMHAFAKDKFS